MADSMSIEFSSRLAQVPNQRLENNRSEEVFPELQVGDLEKVGTQNGSDVTFTEQLKSAWSKVNDDQLAADHAIKELVAGRNKNVHETMLAIEKADLSLKTAMRVRNKILDAYREVMKMQV